MEALTNIAVSLLAGLLMSRLAKVLKLPAVTGYLVAGLLIGPFAIGRLLDYGMGFQNMEQVNNLKPISEVALGFIAFAMGNEFRLSQLRRVGRQAVVVAVIQALAAVFFVDVALIALHFLMPGEITLPVAITLGAIACATAPAATLMVVNQYKASGPLVDILLPIVSLDDAIGLVVFAISFGVAKSLSGGHGISLIGTLVNPLIEVVASLLLGAVLGVIYTRLDRFFHSRSKRLCMAIAIVIMAVSMSMIRIEEPHSALELSFSSLLVCMMLGTVFCNMSPSSDEMMAKTDRWTAPLFVLFFVISGAELELSVFADIAIVAIGLVYIVFRSAGKIWGARLGAQLVHCSPAIQRWLGITLLPQAGVALGMSITVAAELGPEGAIIRNITLFSVLIYELIGPLLTKIALKKAGEIRDKELNPVYSEPKSHRQI